MMNGAVFLLAVNFLVAMCFGAVFAVVATRCRSRAGALWLAAGFGVASLSAVCEMLVAYTNLPKLFGLAAFSSLLGGMVLLRLGIGELYGRPLRKDVGISFLAASMLFSYFIYGLPRGTTVQSFSYQAPFAIAVLSSALAVLSSRRRLMIDRFLGWLMLFTGVHFFAKAWLAVLVGSGVTASDYVRTNYALISQSSTAVLVVAVGLTLLAVLVLEIMTAQQNESDSDALSGLSNRRGFDRAIQSAFAKSGTVGHALVVCDLDHFKSVNDTHGHHVGDLVIQEFSRLLRRHMLDGGVAGRLGGEEFAIFLPATDIEVAVLFAQTLRSATATIGDLPADVKITASFGVTAVASADDLSAAFRRADMALYDAKNSGRNRVKLSKSSGLQADGNNQNGKGNLRVVSRRDDCLD
ncbi:GGDEF domain-containing protein (plasmid) [Aliirhizobium terrae]|uniref:GGDEF domain-containing protein n=1 Tax=Terrirhizobium terrae TaxID=2926709 RepID=UPI002578114F|nr:GGDEF domain-containing protein [Rhizobium sp. CC-CFT758]WJH38649.1 GGDEF domain-containing protein [Rhizobium sp. CC-CFT758]